MKRIFRILNDVIRVSIRLPCDLSAIASAKAEALAKQGDKNIRWTVTDAQETPRGSFCTCAALHRFASLQLLLRLMKIRLPFCAVLTILRAQLHAQSTGIFVNSSNIAVATGPERAIGTPSFLTS
jgi:hypothetical protein